MRLLPERHDHGGGGASEREPEADRRRYRRGHHNICRCGTFQQVREAITRSQARKEPPHEQARFPKMTAAPSSSAAPRSAPASPSPRYPLCGPAVVARPTARRRSMPGRDQADDTVVIRVARSEMGQGSLTGLAQLVAEELECNWTKVTHRIPLARQNVARKRVWGDFSTAAAAASAPRTTMCARRRHRAHDAGPGRGQ